MNNHNQQQQHSQQMDMADMNRKFPGMIFGSQFSQPPNNQRQSQQSSAPPPLPPPGSQMYPVTSLPPVMNGMAQPLDYQRWMAEQSFQQAQQQQVYGAAHQGAGYDQRFNPPPPQYQPQQNNHIQAQSHGNNGSSRSFGSQHQPSGDIRVSISRSPTPPSVELCTSPKFGPGPPIVTSERVKGPRGCNLFVFHLPNEITNWSALL